MIQRWKAITLVMKARAHWNDEIPHHYRFKLFACDFSVCSVEAIFNGNDVLKAIEGHVIEETELTGLYSLNPDVG